MSSSEIFLVPASWKGRAWIDAARYRREYERSLRDPAGFWAEHAARLDWFRKPTKIRNVSYWPDDVQPALRRPQPGPQTAPVGSGDQPSRSV